MCGICGFTGFSGNYERETLATMTGALRHRGPDDSGYFSDDHIHLGHRRLSIIDPDGGHQPLMNENGDVALVFNGEIYNFRELREELERGGHEFATQCDSEVVVHAYEEWGEACVRRFNGMFAFALRDAREHDRGKLFLARDRIGIKPLYYTGDPDLLHGDIAFASELKALLAGLDIPRRLNRKAFNEFIDFRYSLNRNTLLEGIRKLPPAHTLQVIMENGAITRMEEKRYWNLGEKIDTGFNPEAATKRLRELMEDSVKKRLMSDVPLGVYLSGGIDSTTILSIMAAQRKDDDGKIHSFSVGFGELPNELDHALKAAEALGSEHHEFHVETGAVMENIGDIFYHLDEPIADPAVVPTYFISEFTRPKATVVLTGEGADEIFGGYLRYRLAKRAFDLSSKLGPLRRRLPLIGRMIPAWSNYQRHIACLSSGSEAEVYFNTTGLFLKLERKKLLANGGLAGSRNNAAASNIFNGNGFRSVSFLNRMLYTDITNLLPNDFMMKLDKMTMAHSIEGRVPFLDHRIVEFSMTLPERLKLGPGNGNRNGNGYGNGKIILKKAVKGLVPDTIIRRKKRGYNVPFDVWFRQGLGDMIEERVNGHADTGHAVFDRYYTGKLLTRMRRSATGSGDRNYDRNWFTAQKLWAILNFELWKERFGVEVE